MTRSMRSALLWLRNRNGDGMFAKDGVLLAGGDRAPVMRSTWNKLKDAGLAEAYGGRRLRVTEDGRAVNLANVQESE